MAMFRRTCSGVLRGCVRQMCEMTPASTVTVNRFDNQTTKKVSEKPTGLKCMNEITLLGRVGTDPEVINWFHPGIRFLVVTDQQIHGKPGERRTQWHNVACFKESSRDFIAKAVQKGDRVLIKGELEYLKLVPSIRINEIIKLSVKRSREDDLYETSHDEEVSKVASQDEEVSNVEEPTETEAVEAR